MTSSTPQRLIIIAPTRAACETIEIALGLHIETFLERHHGARVRELARSGAGFGIIAGTGTGKTLAVRPIAEEILQTKLRVGVVNREREATPELPDLNVLIVTTGIARRWFQDEEITSRDVLVVDEIHQTSAELELCLALGKRAKCRFIWLSATVNPAFYRKYLGSADVLEVFAFDPNKAADVQVVKRSPLEFVDERFLREIAREKRGVGVFLPTRAGVEQVANEAGERFPKLLAAFYHGGEPIRAIRPFLEDEGAPKPYLLAMTAAGQSALNVRGLDTIVIDDTRFSNVISGGRNVLTRLHLGNNEILQMAGRVHGRVENGRVFILSDREIHFPTLKPTAPEFQLAGDSERVALTCADLGVRADELELPVALDKTSYRRAFDGLQSRGIIDESGRLSRYGKTVESLPTDRAWAELLVNADRDLVPFLAVMSSIESLHRMTREEFDIDGLIVPGSDHLTSYNLYAEAFEAAGYIGEIYDLPRQLFEPKAVANWAESRGVLVKSLEDAALASACILRALHVPLPTQMPLVDETIARRFRDLLARWMPFDLVIEETTSSGESARVGKNSLCGSSGAIAGHLRYFADRQGIPRASIEGTQIPLELIRRYARRDAGEFQYDASRPSQPLIFKRTVEYFGFVLESHSEVAKDWPPELVRQAQRVLSEALARGEAYHRSVKANRAIIEEVRELHRRSGGQTSRLGFVDLAALYEAQMETQNVDSLLAFRQADFSIRVEDFVDEDARVRLWQLPSNLKVRGESVEIGYEIEEENSEIRGVARLRLPEKLARILTERDLPSFDRPLRFIVTRGARGAVRARTLDELQDSLEGPWTPDEEVEEPRFVERSRSNAGQKPQRKAPAAKAKRPNFRGRRGR